MNILLIDNYDSFTYNLYQYLGEVFGVVPTIVKNNANVNELDDYDAIVISPGPGAPWKSQDFGICKHIIETTTKPLLGICLGHQGIVDSLGGIVSLADSPYHGRTSKILHSQDGLFAKLPNPLEVVRYHSLVANEPLPNCLRVTARTESGLIMAVEHTERPMWGVQFHPESIYTEYGRQILQNFKSLVMKHYNKQENAHHPARPKGATPLPRVKASPVAWRCHFRKLSISVEPVRVFDAIFRKSRHSFWLDSSSTSDLADRFSFMGDADGYNAFWFEYSLGQPIKKCGYDGVKIGINCSLSDFLKNNLVARVAGDDSLPFDFCGGFVGYHGHELKAVTESETNMHRSTLPDAAGIFADRFIAFDHATKAVFLVGVTKVGESDEELYEWLQRTENRLSNLVNEPQELDVSRINSANVAKLNGRETEDDEIAFELEDCKEKYLEKIKKCKHYISVGESYEICLTNRIRTELSIDPLDLYSVLRHVNPAPRSAYLHTPNYSVLSSSPEKFVSVKRNGVVEAKPIKGTRKRGATAEKDSGLAHDLSTSEKDRAENLMITDLLRNDLNRVCEVGSVWVPKIMQVETYASVHQLVSTIRGRLKSEYSATDLLYATFPPGSMTGAPKKRTLGIIDELEASARGIYSGAIGYMSLNGSMDLNVAIRTIVAQADRLEIGVGGAITYLSDAEEEYEEILTKGQALMEAISLYANGDRSRFSICSSSLSSARVPSQQSPEQLLSHPPSWGAASDEGAGVKVVTETSELGVEL